MCEEGKCGVWRPCGELKGRRMTDSNLLCFPSLAHSLTLSSLSLVSLSLPLGTVERNCRLSDLLF